MKIASVSGVGVFFIGFLIGNSPVIAGPREYRVPVPAPAGFEKAVDEVAATHDEARRSLHHVEPPPKTAIAGPHEYRVPVPAPAGFEKAVDETAMAHDEALWRW